MTAERGPVADDSWQHSKAPGASPSILHCLSRVHQESLHVFKPEGNTEVKWCVHEYLSVSFRHCKAMKKRKRGHPGNT